ncbi:CapA family protein [Blautia sp. MSJ-19]|uniref:CapA family protein n=1 Tax=Blautia sp. MSJ-19 TaxID=2841517 RepID=UPI001C0EBDB2|nr:CapA family protein [Blautia sp. MSJ-19]MBU5481880.1 CapA family protein [Blautia sp. MSJ-19]
METKNRQTKHRKRKIMKKSRYYREKQQFLYLGIGGAALLLILLTVLVVVRETHSEQAVSASGSGELTKQESEASTTLLTVTPEPEMTPVSLALSVVGDCTLGTDENFDYDTSLNTYYENYGADYFMANVKNIFSADDLTIANFEGTLTESTEREDKQFAFKAPASYADILTAGSIEAVNTANNHSHDYGEESFNDTLKALDAANIIHFGYDETAVTEIKDVKVGLVGIYELNDHLGREEQLKQNIAKVKAEGAQLVVVIFHWGNEKEEVPDENQKTLGHLAIDEGADLVCGHHPHVLQGIEEYKGKNIVYSLGNFCFGGNAYPSDMDTMIFQQTFTIDQNGVKEDNVTNIIPCSISSDSGYNNYQPTPAEGEEANRIMQKIQERSSWIAAGDTANDLEEDTESSSDDTSENFYEMDEEDSEGFTDADETEDPEV